MRWPKDEFARHVPVLQSAGLLPAGRYSSAEGTTQDKRAGIDGIIQNHASGATFTLAQRIHTESPTHEGSITIRESLGSGGLTEMGKMLGSLRYGGALPSINVQIWVAPGNGSGNRLVQAVAIDSRELFRHIVRGVRQDGSPLYCTCVGPRLPSHGGDQNWLRPVAITRAAALRLGTRDTLPGHGVEVRVFRPVDVQLGLPA